MQALSYVLRRYGLLIVAVAFAAYYFYAAHVHGARLTAACNAFAAMDNLVDRSVPSTLPSRMQIDAGRQTIAGICSEHFAGFDYPEDTESATGR